MIFDLYLLMVQRHVRTTWSLICIFLMVQCHARTTWSFLWSVSPHGSVSCGKYMIFDLYLLMVQCHVRTTWSFDHVSPHGSVSCKIYSQCLIRISSLFMSCQNYMIFDMYLLMVQCHVRTKSFLICISSWFSAMSRTNMIFDLYLPMVHRHVRYYSWSKICISSWCTAMSCMNYMIIMICISSWFSVMYEIHDHGSLPCKNYMIVDLYLLMVQCHVWNTWSLICISQWFSGMIRTTWLLIFDLYLLVVQYHVRSLHDRWCLYLLMVQCHVRTDIIFDLYLHMI